jgi:hypothetical protein
MRGWLKNTVACALVLGFGLGSAACTVDAETVLAALGQGCALNSDCDQGLVCTFQVCHQPCTTSKDCPLDENGAPGRCVSEKPTSFCLLETELSCTVHSDCAGDLVCGNDGRCRNACASERDCVQGQACAAGACAEPAELDANGYLPLAPGQSALGKVCSFNSDCQGAGPLSCRAGLCETPCQGDDRDCGRFARCSSTDGEPGTCQLIGKAGSFRCSPKQGEPDREVECDCLDGSKGTQSCNEDGSGYGACEKEGASC